MRSFQQHSDKKTGKRQPVRTDEQDLRIDEQDL